MICKIHDDDDMQSQTDVLTTINMVVDFLFPGLFKRQSVKWTGTDRWTRTGATDPTCLQ